MTTLAYMHVNLELRGDKCRLCGGFLRQSPVWATFSGHITDSNREAIRRALATDEATRAEMMRRCTCSDEARMAVVLAELLFNSKPEE